MWIAVLLVTLAAWIGMWHLYRRAIAFDHGARLALRHATAIRDEVVLIQIDNDTLRREGVWLDEATGEWRGRYAIVVTAASAPAAYSALNAELPGLALRMSRERGPFVVIRH